MLRSVILFLWLVSAIILQFTIFPSYLEDPFKPNLLIILVAYLALRENHPYIGGLFAYLLGLIHGIFSGIYFGLAGISMLLIYLLLKAVADQLYAESAQLMIVAVLAASLLDALLSLLLIVLFTADGAIYHSILANMIPQAVITAFTAFLLFTALPLVRRRLSW
jgi:rod shape-determining protein MreD